MKTLSLRREAGFSLVEVALALGVAAFCLIPLVGLLPVGINANLSTFEVTGASNVAGAVLSDLQAAALINPSSNTSWTTPFYGITIPASPPGSPPFVTFFVRQSGALSGSVGQNASGAQAPYYRVTLYFSSTSTGSNPAPSPFPGVRLATSVRILVTWPALADSTATTPPANFAGSFQTVAGLVSN